MYYLATVNYSMGDSLDRQGNPKIQKVKIIVEGDTVEEVTMVLGNYHNGDTGYDSIDSIKKAPLGDIINREMKPEYYKPKN